MDDTITKLIESNIQVEFKQNTQIETGTSEGVLCILWKETHNPRGGGLGQTAKEALDNALDVLRSHGEWE